MHNCILLDLLKLLLAAISVTVGEKDVISFEFVCFPIAIVM